MRTPLLAILAGVALAAAGCSDSARVKGRLVANGQAVEAPVQAALMFYLIGTDGKPDTRHAYPAPLAADGSFELVASGGVVACGTYLITLEVNATQSATGVARYKSRYNYPNSPLRHLIKSGRNDL